MSISTFNKHEMSREVYQGLIIINNTSLQIDVRRVLHKVFGVTDIFRITLGNMVYNCTQLYSSHAEIPPFLEEQESESSTMLDLLKWEFLPFSKDDFIKLVLPLESSGMNLSFTKKQMTCRIAKAIYLKHLETLQHLALPVNPQDRTPIVKKRVQPTSKDGCPPCVLL